MPEKLFTGKSFEAALAEVRGTSLAEGFNPVPPTPEELHQVYAGGFLGVNENTVSFEERKEFGEFLAAQPKLYDVFPWAKGLGKGKLSAPYLATLQFSPRWGGDCAQTVGSCVSHGTVNAAECDYGSDALMGETTYKGRLSSEGVYRARGYNSHGWYCSAATKYVGPEGKGGFLFRKKYEGPNGEVVDLTNFSSQTEAWASKGSQGVPAWLEAIAAKNKAKWIIPVDGDLDIYRDIMACGFGINVCSGVGYSNTTDEFGVAKRQGSWAHSMAHNACDDREWAHTKYNILLGLIFQSWGPWNKQNGRPDGAPPMPIGSFYSRGTDVLSMIKGGDSFGVCGLRGYDRIDWEGFMPVQIAEELTVHLRDSTTCDWYEARAKRSLELVTKALDEGFNPVPPPA